MKLSDSCNMHEFVFSSSYSSFKPFDRMSLKLPTIKGIAHALGSLYLVGIQTQLVFNLIEHVLCHIIKKERPGAVLVFMTGWDDINSLKDQLQAHPILGDPRRVLLLACHGSMASSEQRLIFDKPEDGVRKIVLATNMAETSITINDVVFVVDCGKAKETSYDALNNTPCLLPSWISKAAARQVRPTLLNIDFTRFRLDVHRKVARIFMQYLIRCLVLFIVCTVHINS
ncbi:hypothetical protein OIU77_008172 [Salix suchowensis]|uniref:RNA helicase n=1 Tax=Salix suchowensis TaxID=1278906 RepID=A0ABQ9AIM0_9ROSI|nr:hypothetical protein OIU77_008172 [Salix suchowensis]